MGPALALLLLACNPDRCDAPTDCAADEICNTFEDRCEPALDRPYDVIVDRAIVGPNHPDGAAWDEDLSEPDLWVELGIDFGDTCATTVRDDDATPEWDEICDGIHFPADGDFLINVWDADAGDDGDFAAGFYWEDDAALIDLARDATMGEISVIDSESQTVELHFWLEPAAP